MKKLIICLCIILLVGCTSKPLNVRYYLLHNPEKLLSSEIDNNNPLVVLELVNVADYLRQSSLVMQVQQHQLYYSKQDVWAEKLQSSFYKALLQDLNTNEQRNYVASNTPNAKDASISIRVSLDHFHATDQSTVVSSGRYWLSNEELQTNNNENQSFSHTFFFESQLEKDGYAQAVTQLRTLITTLAKQIEKDIAALPDS